MCGKCMDQSSDDLLAKTGIHKESLAMLDMLLIAAITLGDQIEHSETEIVGDPLLPAKEPLVGYIAAL